MLKHVLEQNSSHLFPGLNFSSRSDRPRMLLFLLFWNWPLTTLLKITPTNEKKADLMTRTLLPRSMLVPQIQAYNILLLSTFLRTMWWAASSAMYKHVALVTCTSLISCTCIRGDVRGKDRREQACGKARESSSFQLPALNFRTCQAANTQSKYKKRDLWDQATFRSSIQHHSINQIVMPGLLQWFHLLATEQYGAWVMAQKHFSKLRGDYTALKIT